MEYFTQNLNFDLDKTQRHGMILPPIHWASILGSVEIFKMVKLHFLKFDSEINTPYYLIGTTQCSKNEKVTYQIVHVLGQNLYFLSL